MRRIPQFVLIASTVGLSWFLMMAVHEFGHVLGAWVSGGEVIRVVLNPRGFSGTQLGANPHPGIVVWSGAILGGLIPLAIFLLARFLRMRHAFLFRFFAGFCFLVNGIYIGCISPDIPSDSAIMFQVGAPRWVLIVFGLVWGATGLWLWHGLGRYFGLGVPGGEVDRKAALTMPLVLVGTILVLML